MASNSERFIKAYLDENKKNLICIIKDLKKEEKLKLYFIKKGGLELIFSFIKYFPDLLELLEVFNSEERFIIQINNIKGYNKLVNILFMSDENIQNFKLDHFKFIVGILEDSSHVEIVRKTISEMKNFEDLFLAAFNKFDISSKEILGNKDTIIILMHFFTFICNICYSSPKIRQDICNNFSHIMNKIYQFTNEFKLDFILNKNLLETILSFLTNLSCDDQFRMQLSKEENFISFLITQLKSITLLCRFTEDMEKAELIKNDSINNNGVSKGGVFKYAYFENFKVYEDFFEKTICLLYNLSYTDNLNYFYVEKNLPESLIYFIVKILGPFNQEENKKYFTQLKKDYSTEFNQITLIRVLMILAKITKILPIYNALKSDTIFNNFTENKQFYPIIFGLLIVDNYKKNVKIIDNSVKYKYFF